MKTGFIGLGNIGKPIAQCMARAGRDLAVFDLAEEPLAELKAMGATIADSPGEMAKSAKVIGICVRNDDDVLQVMNGQDGILANARKGLLVVLHSTVTLSLVKQIGAEAAQAGVRIVDAPVSRGQGVDGANFVFMLGGDPDDVAEAREFVEPAACKIVQAGPLGTGMVLKLCNNNLTYLGVVAVHDALRLARSGGADPAALAEVISANGVGSANVIGTLSRGVTRMSGNSDGHDLPELEPLIGLAEKDLDNTLALAREIGIDLPSVEMTRQAIAASFRGT